MFEILFSVGLFDFEWTYAILTQVNYFASSVVNYSEIFSKNRNYFEGFNDIYHSFLSIQNLKKSLEFNISMRLLTVVRDSAFRVPDMFHLKTFGSNLPLCFVEMIYRSSTELNSNENLLIELKTLDKWGVENRLEILKNTVH